MLLLNLLDLINEWTEGMQFEFIVMAYIYINILPTK